MDELAPLGTAIPDRSTVTAWVAEQLSEPVETVTITEISTREFPYAVASITTVSRKVVSGVADTSDGSRPFAFFVKQVQCWSHSPFFSFVPEPAREFAKAGVPWRTEPAAYAADLRLAMPPGLRLPHVYAVNWLPDDAAVIWMQHLDQVPERWDEQDAARLLGRFAGSAAVRAYAEQHGHGLSVSHYVHGRLAQQVFPALLADDFWSSTAAAPFAPVRARLLDIIARAPALAAELDGLPRANGHGDACPANLIAAAEAPDEITMIDLNYFGEMPVGFDLGQLLVGDVQLGHADHHDLPGRSEQLITAYAAGLAAEGMIVPLEVVRRAHAVQLVLYSALTMPPVDSPEGDASVASHRLAVAEHALDLLDATE